MSQIENPFEAINHRLELIATEQARINRLLEDKEKTETDLLTVEEAMKLLGKAKQSLYELTSKNLIPHFKKRGTLYFSKKQLIEWATEQGFAQHLVSAKIA